MHILFDLSIRTFEITVISVVKFLITCLVAEILKDKDTTIVDKNRGKNRFVTQNNTFVYLFCNFGPHPPVSMLFLVMELEIDIPTWKRGELSMVLEFFPLLPNIFVQDCSHPPSWIFKKTEPLLSIRKQLPNMFNVKI